jgi:hypothetical protein
MALRLTFAYRGDDIRLEAQERVEMTAVGSDDVDVEETLTGFWCELQDDEGHSLYRRLLQNPSRRSIEVPTDDPEQPLAQHPIDEPQGILVLVVPELEAASSLVLIRARPGLGVAPDAPERQVTEEQPPQGRSLETTEVFRKELQ